jgi:hypothetical protein
MATNQEILSLVQGSRFKVQSSKFKVQGSKTQQARGDSERTADDAGGLDTKRKKSQVKDLAGVFYWSGKRDSNPAGRKSRFPQQPI